MNYFLDFSYCSKSFDINLHNWLLKNTADFICVPLCKLFNKSCTHLSFKSKVTTSYNINDSPIKPHTYTKILEL